MPTLAKPAPLFVEIGPDRLKARRNGQGMELALERGPNGRLTAQARQQAIAALTEFCQAKSWQPRPRAWCAIGARGVSLRRLSLPGGTGNEFHNRLLLQIEAEFPLPPEALAWGYQPISQPQPQSQPQNGVVAKQDLLVAAVKKELLSDYDEILRAGGTEPVFVLASLARWNFYGQPADTFAMLEVGAAQSELTWFEGALPVSSRIVFSGRENASGGAEAAAETLAQNLRDNLAGAKVFVSGDGVSKEFAGRLAKSVGNGCECQPVEVTPAGSGSAAIAGLEKLAAQTTAPALIIRMTTASGARSSFATLDWKKWGTRVGLLILAVLALPYGEALLLRPHLERKVAAFKQDAERLQVIDRELDFLRNLKQSQPPYLDVLYVFSKSAPPGTRFDSLSLNSRGEVALRTIFHDGQQVADFRDKLIASGFFTNVVVAEQAPTPDRQRVTVRMSAQEKPAAQLLALAAALPVEETKTTAPTSAGMQQGARRSAP